MVPAQCPERAQGAGRPDRRACIARRCGRGWRGLAQRADPLLAAGCRGGRGGRGGRRGRRAAGRGRPAGRRPDAQGQRGDSRCRGHAEPCRGEAEPEPRSLELSALVRQWMATRTDLRASGGPDGGPDGDVIQLPTAEERTGPEPSDEAVDDRAGRPARRTAPTPQGAAPVHAGAADGRAHRRAHHPAGVPGRVVRRAGRRGDRERVAGLRRLEPDGLPGVDAAAAPPRDPAGPPLPDRARPAVDGRDDHRRRRPGPGLRRRRARPRR